MSSGFESINENLVTQSETDPTSSEQHTEDELNSTTFGKKILVLYRISEFFSNNMSISKGDEPAHKDEIKEEFKINEISKKDQGTSSVPAEMQAVLSVLSICASSFIFYVYSDRFVGFVCSFDFLKGSEKENTTEIITNCLVSG